MQSLQLSGSQIELKECAAAHRLKECELKRKRVAANTTNTKEANACDLEELGSPQPFWLKARWQETVSG